jgi:acyl carrier protein
LPIQFVWVWRNEQCINIEKIVTYVIFVINKMNRTQIIETINNFLIEDIEVAPEALKENAFLKEDLGIDSLDFVDIVVVVEQNFGFKIKPEEMAKVKTLLQFYDYIEGKLKANN